MTGPVETAREAWGDALPDWVLSLAQACAASSQSKVAAKLGRSGSLISTVLRAKYPGDLAGIEERVRGLLMSATVECPAMGNLPTHECQDWRKKARDFAPHNMQRVMMYRACKSCPINREVEK